MNQVRWGLLSTANINRALIPAIRASQRGQVVAVASRDLAKAQAYATYWEIPLAFGSYQAMLHSGKVDAVYVGLPNHLHAEWTVAALNAGIHVLCEKPFALTLEQTDAMIAASQQNGRVLAEAFMYRHHPQTKIVGEWIASGRLGEICLIQGSFGYVLHNRQDVRLVPEWGGGCLWDIGIYPLSFAQYLMGEAPETVFGQQWLGETGIDELFVGQLQYSGNRFAQINASFRTPFQTYLEIIGTTGRLYLERPFNYLEANRPPIFYPVSGEVQKLSIPPKELYAGEVEDMQAAILDGVPPYLSLEETRNHVRTTLALYQSAGTGQPIKLAEIN